MTTRKIVPRATGEGGIGTAVKRWGDSYLGNVDATSVNIAEGQTYDINGSPHSHTAADGIDTFHGVESIGTISFDNSSHVLSVASITYWYKGTQYTTASATTCDLDLTADRDHASAELTTNTLYYFYFKDATGKLYWSPSFWSLHDEVPVATVFWNGSAGAVCKEAHNYTRNIDWHMWTHLTVGARYVSGLGLTYPTTSVDGSLQIESGSIYDEDILISIGQQTTMRGYYKASAGVFTFADYALPYLGTSGAPVYLDTDTYVLTLYAANKYACFWVFATGDIDRPIAVVPSHISVPHSQVSDARTEVQPTITGLNPEWKLIYRFIFSGDGQFQESTDYRLQTSIAGGVSASSNASAVAFSPAGNIAATNVQTAIEELDTEKSSTSHTHSDATTGTSGFMSTTDKTKLDGVATGATAYTDALARSAVIASSISDGDTTHAPDGNSVFDALATKAPLSNPTFSGTVNVSSATLTLADNQISGDKISGGVADLNGVKFPATQSASSDANTLDDYEEGSWTPGMETTTGSVSLESSSGSYVKIGKQVTVIGVFRTNGISSPTGNVYITGLPFTVGITSTGSLFINRAFNPSLGTSPIALRLDSTAAKILIAPQTGGDWGTFASYLDADCGLYVTATYFV